MVEQYSLSENFGLDSEAYKDDIQGTKGFLELKQNKTPINLQQLFF